MANDHPIQSPKARTYISWLTIAFMMVAAVASIRSLPAMAVYGLGSILLFLVPAIVFFIPVALVASELGTGWNGGIYGWVKQAFGERLGFFVIWFLWIEVVVWYPSVLGFAASTLAYMFNPSLAENGLFTCLVIIIFYWASTLLAMRGFDTISRFTKWFMLLGTALPAACLVILGIVWLIMGHPSATPIDWNALIPSVFHENTHILAGAHHLHSDYWKEFVGSIAGLVLIVSNFLAYAGIEMNAIHARELKNPQRQMPKAILLASIMIVLIFIPPTLAISLVIPAGSTSLTAGVIQAYAAFFDAFHIAWITPVLGLLLIIGALGGVLGWTVGPSKGLLFVGKSGMFPPILQKVNKNGVQQNILILQAILVTLLSTAYVFIDNVSDAFWMLSAMAALMYLIIYVFMFLSALKLRKTQPDVKRGFVLKGLHFWCFLGLAATLLAIFFGLIPPSQFSNMPVLEYIGILVAGLIITGAPPFIFYALKKPSWQVMPPHEAEAYSAPLQELEHKTPDGN